MKVEHLSTKTLENAVESLSSKLLRIKELTFVDKGQSKAPTKQDYRNALLGICRIIEEEA